MTARQYFPGNTIYMCVYIYLWTSSGCSRRHLAPEGGRRGWEWVAGASAPGDGTGEFGAPQAWVSSPRLVCPQGKPVRQGREAGAPGNGLGAPFPPGVTCVAAAKHAGIYMLHYYNTDAARTVIPRTCRRHLANLNHSAKVARPLEHPPSLWGSCRSKNPPVLWMDWSLYVLWVTDAHQLQANVGIFLPIFLPLLAILGSWREGRGFLFQRAPWTAFQLLGRVTTCPPPTDHPGFLADLLLCFPHSVKQKRQIHFLASAKGCTMEWFSYESPHLIQIKSRERLDGSCTQLWAG